MKGALPLFRLAGIRVYLHFTWFIVAALEVTRFAHRYHNPIWAALEYCALFGVVLLHEFGHAFACRQTSGQADTIVLWPLAGSRSSDLQLDLVLTFGVSQPGHL
jgi:Zn-dependent protease